jgi:signal peptidase I
VRIDVETHEAPSTKTEISSPAPYAGLAAGLLRAIWFVVLPGLLAAFAMRYLVPAPAEAKGTWMEPAATWADDHLLGVFVVLFLFFAALASHWRRYLPGGSYLSPTTENTEAAKESLSVKRLAGAVLVGAAAAAAFRSGFGSYRVLGGSMLPTLSPGDLVGGSKLAYVAGPRERKAPTRGDVVVFEKPPGAEGPSDLIKRVIGLPGDTVNMRGGHAIINGWEVPSCDAGGYFYPFSGGGASGRVHLEFLEDRTYLTLLASSGSGPAFEPYVVREGEVFVLGDNRSNSSDSRAWNEGRGGGLPITSIEARADRWLLGLHRDEHVDLGGALRPIDLHLRLENIDTQELQDGIENCLRNRPAQTHPPEKTLAGGTSGLGKEPG